MSAMSRLALEVADTGIPVEWVYAWLESHEGTWDEAFIYVNVAGVCECCGVSMAD